jgi:hypothetical protein
MARTYLNLHGDQLERRDRDGADILRFQLLAQQLRNIIDGLLVRSTYKET